MTKSNFNKSNVALAVVLALAMLTACGGGGGGASTASNNQATVPSVPTPTVVASASVAIVNVAPAAPTYADEELVAYNAFNTARSGCGFGYVQQSVTLDTAAYNHVYWEALNRTTGHYEVAATTGFTGVDPTARAIFAGYSNPVFVNEVLVRGGATLKAGYGLFGARGLLSAPYHMSAIFDGNREIGISVKTGGPVGSGSDIESSVIPNVVPSFLVDMGASSTLLPQQQSSTDVLTYPCQGVTGTAISLKGESPNPIPGRSLTTNPIGQPIFVQVKPGNALVISNVSVAGPAGYITLEPTMTSLNDPNGYLTANKAIVMPSSPLLPNTIYSVAMTGTNGGVTFTKIFAFTTGS